MLDPELFGPMTFPPMLLLLITTDLSRRFQQWREGRVSSLDPKSSRWVESHCTGKNSMLSDWTIVATTPLGDVRTYSVHKAVIGAGERKCLYFGALSHRLPGTLHGHVQHIVAGSRRTRRTRNHAGFLVQRDADHSG